MNRKIILSLILLLVFSIVFFGCASTPKEEVKGVDTISATVNAGSDESILVFQRKKSMMGAAISMKIWLNDVEVASGIKNGQEIQIVIPNGEHTLQAGSTNVDKGNTITFSADSEMIIFFAEPAMGAFAARFNLTQLGRRKL